MKEIMHKSTLFIYDEEHPGIEVTNDLYQDSEGKALTMDITGIVQNIDSDNDYVYTLVIYSDFIRLYRYRDVANDFAVRTADIILDIDNGNITFNKIIPVILWDGIINMLQESNTKINGIDIADYLSGYDIYKPRIA